MSKPNSSPAILQVIPGLDTGGAELSTLEMVEALHAVGARARVATQGGRMQDEVVRRGGELIMFPAASKNPLQMLRNVGFLADLCKREGVALVHARSRAPAWSALGAARRAGLPYVTTYHGAYNEGEPFKRLYNSVMARGDRVIANSRYTANLVMQRHSPAPERLSVIYRGVDVQVYQRQAVDEGRLEALRAAWGVSAGQKLILHPARLTGWKGQTVVVEAAALLAQKLQNGANGQDVSGKGENGREETDFVFILAGDHQGRDDYKDALLARIKELGLEGRVRLVGHCDDMAAAYAAAYVTLIASIEPEAFGRTSAEAQAMGCPVIATNIGAPPETVLAAPNVAAGEITGWLTAPQQPQALADALGEVLAVSSEDYKAMAARARLNVTRNYTDLLMKHKTLAVYDELLGAHLADMFRQRFNGRLGEPSDHSSKVGS